MAEHRITLIEPVSRRPLQLAGRVSPVTVREALLISTLAFLVLAALTIVAGLFVVLLGRAYERDRDRERVAYQRAADIRSQTARANAVDALNRALDREAENIRARERTALLIREAAALQARAATSRAPPDQRPTLSAAPPIVDAIVQGTTDGSLSPTQRGKMIAVLIRRPGDVTVMSGTGSVAERRAAELRSVFTASGWRVESGIVVDPKIPLAPLSLVLGSSEQDGTLLKAFRAAGVVAAERPRSPMDRPSTIYVGS